MGKRSKRTRATAPRSYEQKTVPLSDERETWGEVWALPAGKRGWGSASVILTK